MELVTDVPPSSLGRYEEGILVGVRIVSALLHLVRRTTAIELVFNDLIVLLLEHIARPLEEQRPEDVLLELRRVHLAPQDVGSSEKMAF